LGIRELWVMGSKSLPTNLVDQKSYGVWESMGYQGYGLRGCQLYVVSGCHGFANPCGYTGVGQAGTGMGLLQGTHSKPIPIYGV
jgi:hypothetical protein